MWAVMSDWSYYNITESFYEQSTFSKTNIRVNRQILAVELSKTYLSLSIVIVDMIDLLSRP